MWFILPKSTSFYTCTTIGKLALRRVNYIIYLPSLDLFKNERGTCNYPGQEEQSLETAVSLVARHTDHDVIHLRTRPEEQGPGGLSCLP